MAEEPVPELKYFLPCPCALFATPCHKAPRPVSDGNSRAVEEGSVRVDIIMAKSGGHPTVLKERTYVKHQFLKNLSVLIRKEAREHNVHLFVGKENGCLSSLCRRCHEAIIASRVGKIIPRLYDVSKEVHLLTQTPNSAYLGNNNIQLLDYGWE